MKYVDLRFVILIFGYVLLSETAGIWITPSTARALSAFALMMIIYWVPSRLKNDLINWLGGSMMVAICIYLVNDNFSIVFTIMLLAIFFLSYFKR